MLSDLEIAQSAPLKPIAEIAELIGIDENELYLFGRFKAKIQLELLQRLKGRPDGKYINITAITPTPLGEGKTVTTIGLGMALNRIGKRAVSTIRQPSMGPTFGIKGGAAGGGYSQVVPMEDFNLHFTGDNHAVGSAHNLLAAFIDNHLHHGNQIGIDPDRVTWPRVLDMSDRPLRGAVIGLGGSINGMVRETQWDITAASEIMAILGLTNGYADLRQRLDRIVVASADGKNNVTAGMLKATGAMMVLLKDAIKPNLIQTIENTPCLVHTGPFANIAHGNSSVLADLMGLKLADYVVTESGFGADIGAEKFFNIKCRQLPVKPSTSVLVCTVRALKMHSGGFMVVAGKPLDEGLLKPDPKAVEDGCSNLVKQIENVKLHGVPVVVAINRFDTDHAEELDVIRKQAMAAGANAVIESRLWVEGSVGGEELAKAVVEAAETPNEFAFLYPLTWSIQKKVETIAKKIYGAGSIEYSPKAHKQIERYTQMGWDKLPICMAKTHLSLSTDPRLKGRPKNFDVHVREIRASIGAGFLNPILGDMMTLPGLPSHPSGEKMDVDETGRVLGLS